MAHVLARKDKQKPGFPKGKFVLPTDQLKKREKAFVIYRDMGSARSIYALEKLLRTERPDIAASRVTLEKWSKQHNWQERVKQHEAAAITTLQRAGQHGELTAEFDQVDKLMRTGAGLSSSQTLKMVSICYFVAHSLEAIETERYPGQQVKFVKARNPQIPVENCRW